MSNKCNSSQAVQDGIDPPSRSPAQSIPPDKGLRFAVSEGA